ncbi:MAG: hypothetical protein ON057_001600 [Glomeribacter sp. 1016415]|nr:hypothetical protein [Glomeribacter sp. 1016415]
MNTDITGHAPLSLADCLTPNWPVAARVRILFTTRAGGVSAPPYGLVQNGTESAGGLNLGLHTGDEAACVAENRKRLATLTGTHIAWLEQVHKADVIRAEIAINARNPSRADASVTAQPGIACAIMTADCLPVLICDHAGRAVGAAHAGWRGLAAGVLERTAAEVAALTNPYEELYAFLGPAIGPRTFEVGDDVRNTFLTMATAAESSATAAAFRPCPHLSGKYWADLFELARLRLIRAGIKQISGGAWCTASDPTHFYSYRRQSLTGRQAALIWLEHPS